jgi:hypothetical protein
MVNWIVRGVRSLSKAFIEGKTLSRVRGMEVGTTWIMPCKARSQHGRRAEAFGAAILVKAKYSTVSRLRRRGKIQIWEDRSHIIKTASGPLHLAGREREMCESGILKSEIKLFRAT